MHHIAWDVMKKSKAEGGLGIKDLQCQNKAFMMKLCWGIITKPDALWVKCLKGKYNVGTSSLLQINKRKNQSAVWNGVTTVWEAFCGGLGKKLKNGVTTKAWQDHWAPLERPLMYYVERNLHMVNQEDRVRDFVIINGQWNRSKWRSFLPGWVVDRIMTINPPIGSNDDVFYWRKASDGNFSVKSAYTMLYHKQGQPAEPSWQRLWRWEIPERAKFFMWQVFHERLPTNALRAKINPTVQDLCPFECECEESILHILRDCEIAKRVWSGLTNPLYHTIFFSGNLQDWLKWNSRNCPGNRISMRWPWHRTFGIACWLLWKNRCRKVFEGVCDQPKAIAHRCIFHLMEEVENGRFHHRIMRVPDRSETKWVKPPQGFVRLDVDGSCIANGWAACGGVIRDHQGNWICGFQQKLGHSTSTAAEIHAIYKGLLLCKQWGLDKVKLYTDSLEAIHLLLVDCGEDHPLKDEVQELRSLILSKGDVEITHVYREGIRCADYLARMAQKNQQVCEILLTQPMACAELFRVECGDMSRMGSCTV